MIALSYIFYGTGILLLGLAVFSFRFAQKFIDSIAASISIIVAYSGSVLILNISWKAFSSSVATISAAMLRLFMDNVTLELTNADPKLSAEGFSVIIGAPCSGILSLSMFLGIFALVIAYDFNRIRRHKIIKYLVIGLIGMYTVSVLRVYTLMVLGARVSPDIALGMFHNNAGWTFFIVYTLFFWYYSYPRLVIKPAIRKSPTKPGDSQNKLFKKKYAKDIEKEQKPLSSEKKLPLKRL